MQESDTDQSAHANSGEERPEPARKRRMILIVATGMFAILAALAAGAGIAVFAVSTLNKPDATSELTPPSAPSAPPSFSPTPTPSQETIEQPVVPPLPPVAPGESVAPPAPACGTGTVDFAVYYGRIEDYVQSNGDRSASIVVTAKNNTTVAINIKSQANAWGVDGVGHRILPMPASWSSSDASFVLPGTVVAASGLNTIVTPEQAAAVVGFVTLAKGYVIVDWAEPQPIGCPARPTITG